MCFSHGEANTRCCSREPFETVDKTVFYPAKPAGGDVSQSDVTATLSRQNTSNLLELCHGKAQWLQRLHYCHHNLILSLKKNVLGTKLILTKSEINTSKFSEMNQCWSWIFLVGRMFHLATSCQKMTLKSNSVERTISLWQKHLW